MARFIWLSLSLILSLGISSFSIAESYREPRYFATVYGSEKASGGLIGSHIFCRLEKIDSSGKIVEKVDMSLMPDRHAPQTVIEKLRSIFLAKNLSLEATLALASSEGKRIGNTGRVEVKQSFYAYQKARVQMAVQGVLRYSLFDTFKRGEGYVNCRTFVAGDGYRGLLSGPEGAKDIVLYWQRLGYLVEPRAYSLVD